MSRFPQLEGLKAVIVGAAREGTALSRFLAACGARVTLADAKSREALAEQLNGLEELGITFCLGGQEPALAQTDVVFLSPGVPPTASIVVRCREMGIPLSSEPRLFIQLCGMPIVGITGSSGKTTTTALTGLMLEKSGQSVWVGGNIGTPLIEKLDTEDSADTAVMELSSFQLELFSPDYQGQSTWQRRTAGSRAVNLQGSSPHVAVVTNITPNHLDRHPSMENYVQAKTNILRYQSPEDWVVLNADDPWTPSLAELTPAQKLYFSIEHKVAQGGWLEKDELVLRFDGETHSLGTVNEVHLRGRHNLANVLTAACTALAAGASIKGIRAAIAEFEGVPHRLEVVRVVDGVTYINDSIATSPERAIAALRAFRSPVVLLAGGRDKHLPWDVWAQVVSEHTRLVVAFGEAVPIIRDALEEYSVELVVAENLAKAVRTAAANARPGEVVLLSPGGTSFDAYRDFEERGIEFRRLVNELKEAQ